VDLDPHLRDDSIDPAATASRVAELVAGEMAETWAVRIAGRDCCCSIVATVEEAMRDPHFLSRGVFGPQRSGEPSPLPLPIDRAFSAND